MSLEQRAQALLELIETDRVRKCDAILAEARRQGDALRAEAYAEARSRIRNAFTEERARSEARIAAARASLETRRRLDRQQRASALVAAGLARLRDELARRWADVETRAMWCESIVSNAYSVLPRAPWEVTHPADWPEVERNAFAAKFAGDQRAIHMSADARVRAGLRIAAGGTVVDGTLDGLLADRDEIGARVLHAIEVAR